jgi:ribonuclease E
MPNKMLIDATHPEETRVVVLRGNRVEEFDFESANRKQLRGNIYLAKVTRVEPSLQAAFVDYGGNRHGFLAFSEIHPDYYQIPVADRQALIDEEERAQRAADVEADHRAGRRSQRGRASEHSRHEIKSEPVEAQGSVEAMAAGSESMAPEADTAEGYREHVAPLEESAAEAEAIDATSVENEAPATPQPEELPASFAPEAIDLTHLESSAAAEPIPQGGDEPSLEVAGTTEMVETGDSPAVTAGGEAGDMESSGNGGNITEISEHNAGSGEEEVIESVGGSDAMEELPERMPRQRRQQYKIQEVIKRRQVMLVQVVKEERGTKGAALTTYLSLAGRYSVLMPNTARGGGISRKITDGMDRRRLKEIAQELEVPEGMGVILRTAGASRTKTEVKRDFEYLLRLWETVRDLTLKSTAPTLVYEEGSLVKRSIRDLYNKDIEEILVAGDQAYKEAKGFMRMLMPSHAKNVKPYMDTLPVLTRFGIESQLDAMFQPVVQLRSGGYIVINQTEALVAIDVNSGRATREHHIEDTALKTNSEAAEEIARQLRLRDLAGLIVIDFIDMDEKRNNRTVERRLKESLKHDRARIQVGHISHFGLLEMSRQRIRSSVLESSTEKCPLCGGTGHMRSVSSVSLQLLRALEEMLLKGATHNMIVRTRTDIALYLLNQKRSHLRALEERFQIAIVINADASIGGQVSYVIEKGELVHTPEQAKAIAAQSLNSAPIVHDDEDDDIVEAEDEVEEQEEDTAAEEFMPEAESEDEPVAAMPGMASADDRPAEADGHRRRRRRRGRRGESREGAEASPGAAAEHPAGASSEDEDGGSEAQASESNEEGAGRPETNGESRGDAEHRRRRRGRRGGRRNRRDRDGEAPQAASDQPGGEAASGFEAGAGAGAEAGTHAESHAEPMPEQRDADTWRQPDAFHAQEPIEQPVAAVPPRESSQESTAPAQPEGGEQAPSRRRSTVREPAPANFSGQPLVTPVPAYVVPTAEPPQPAVSEASASEDPSRPRRSGWWSRRVLGKE